MGIHYLSGVCFAVFFIPSLVLANDVRVGVSPTTGYYSVTSKTFSVPKGATVSPSTAVSPVVTPLSGGGFQQSMSGGITIEALKKPAPFTARAAAGLQTMKNGAKKLARSNPARLLAGAGLAAFLDSLDWIIDDGSKISKVLPPSITSPVEPSGSSTYCYRFNGSGCYDSAFSACSIKGYPHVKSVAPSPNHSTVAYCYSNPSATNAQGYVTFASFSSSLSCPDGSSLFRNGCVSDSPSVEPVSLSDLDDSIDSKYNPDSSDFVLLTPYMPPDYILVDPIPPVQTDLGITNTFDSSGSLTGTVQKTSTTNFTVSNNSTSQPSISSSTSVKTETFKDGQSQGSTVTDTSQPAVVGGGGGGSNVDIDIPTDCEFMPTVCAFLDWFKNDDTPDDPDLSALIDNRDFTETYSITGGSKQCPADYEFTVDFIGRTYGLSFEPACDFASKMYYFVMAAAYIFAAYITIGASRNG